VNPDPQVIVQNLGQISNIIGTISILMGLGLSLFGFFTLKRYGEARTFMSHQMTLWQPLMQIVAGSMLLILPTFIRSALYAFWSTSSPLVYHATPDGWDSYIPAVLVFVRLIGAGAIIRAIVMFARTGVSGSQPGTIGKAITFLFAGILLMHILGVYNLLEQILDIAS
jgi:intracellular multiplication protein IcmC